MASHIEDRKKHLRGPRLGGPFFREVLLISKTEAGDRRLLVEPADEGRYGSDVFAVGYDLPLKFEAGVRAQLALEVGTEHLLALGAVPYAHRWKFWGFK